MNLTERFLSFCVDNTAICPSCPCWDFSERSVEKSLWCMSRLNVGWSVIKCQAFARSGVSYLSIACSVNRSRTRIVHRILGTKAEDRYAWLWPLRLCLDCSNWSVISATGRWISGAAASGPLASISAETKSARWRPNLNLNQLVSRSKGNE